MDEIGRLRRANPVAADDLDHLVAVDRECLIEAMEMSGQPSRIARRPSLPALGSALAAAVILAFVVFTVGYPLGDEDFIEASVISPIVDSEDAETERFDRTVDMLAVHLDYADRADGHTAVAALEVTNWFDLEPIVVAGTQSPDSERPVHEYATVMDSVWDSGWLDASLDHSRVVQLSADRWLSTFDEGGTVWVAEGGVSDFTAEVVREVGRQRPDLDTAASIRVVQHSDRNEVETRSGDLAFVQLNTTYVRIDGGDKTNTTANLATPSSDFERAVSTGGHAGRWTAVFEYFESDELDFADIVSVLHILDVGVEHVATADDYADFFIGDQPDAALRGSS